MPQTKCWKMRTRQDGQEGRNLILMIGLVFFTTMYSKNKLSTLTRKILFTDTLIYLVEIRGLMLIHLFSLTYSIKSYKYTWLSLFLKLLLICYNPWLVQVIEEANWLTLTRDVPVPSGGYDALVIMGNSFAHLPDSHGDQRDQR